MPKVKDKERTLTAARDKQLPQGSSHNYVSWLLQGNSAGQKGLAGNTQSHEKQGLEPRCSV